MTQDGETETERKGHLFREKPFYCSLMFSRVQSPAVRELLMHELIKEHEMYHMVYGIEESRQ